MYDPEKVTYFGETDARNKKVKFGIKAKDRSRHMYVIGKTGMGKSTLLENMAIQDIQSGEGMAFIDPHGKTADLLLDYVPEERIKDVIYFAPFDTDFPISFNVMEDVGPARRHLVVSGLMSAFEKIWVDAWSARMSYILQNTLAALLEYPDSTMLGINRMLADKIYRTKVVDNITDPSVRSFWVDEFAKYTERFAAEATPAIQNKVGQFVNNSLVRNIIGQSRSTFDMRKVMDDRKILIVNLSKGQVGETNAKLLGGMLITKIYLAAMSRADRNDDELKKLPNFYLHVDEFQSFANKSFADILSEARKYKLNLTIAHQYVEQMEEEVRDAVFGNVGTMITFRVGALDAELLEKEFAPTFTAEDMVNLGFIQVYLKLMIDGISSQPFSATTTNTPAKPERTFRKEVIDMSRMQFAQPRAAVEKAILAWHEEGNPNVKKEVHGPKKEPYIPKENFKRENLAFASAPAQAGRKEPFTPYPRAAERKEKKDFDKEKRAMFDEMMQSEKNPEAPKAPEQKISLKSIEQQNTKNPSAGHVSDLKQALAALTKKPTVSQVGAGQSHIQKQNPPKAPVKPSILKTENPRVEQRQEIPKPSTAPESQKPPEPVKEKKPKNEIPQDELLSMLKVDIDES